MLGGIDPIVIFQFKKKADSLLSTTVAKIPLVSDVPTFIEMPPIPIYLSEELTGILVESEDKNVDISTDTETVTDGTEANINQKGIGSTLSITMTAKKSSIGVMVLSALMEQIFDKVTSKEYAISYLHGATTIFRAVLQHFSISQNATNDLVTIRVDLSTGQKTPKAVSPVLTVPGEIATLPGA